MKAAVALVGVVAVFGSVFASPSGREVNLDVAPYEAYIFEDLINSIINSVVAVVAQFDPLDIESEEQDLLGHHGEISNLHAEGFSNIVATNIRLSGLITWTLDLTIVAPRIVGSVENWKVDGEHIYGNGSANVVITDVEIKVVASINPITLNIKDLKITPSIGYADVSITGIYDDEEISQQVNDFLNALLNDVINNDKELHDRISKVAQEVLQKILDTLYV